VASDGSTCRGRSYELLVADQRSFVGTPQHHRPRLRHQPVGGKQHVAGLGLLDPEQERGIGLDHIETDHLADHDPVFLHSVDLHVEVAVVVLPVEIELRRRRVREVLPQRLADQVAVAAVLPRLGVAEQVTAQPGTDLHQTRTRIVDNRLKMERAASQP